MESGGKGRARWRDGMGNLEGRVGEIEGRGGLVGGMGGKVEGGVKMNRCVKTSYSKRLRRKENIQKGERIMKSQD